MNLSMKWLADYVKADMPIADFARGMTMSGSKVEKWTDLSAPLERIVCGRVQSIERHADSDKLWIAQVLIGDSDDSTVQIVTAAQNVTAGALLPVVLDGGAVVNRQDSSVLRIKRGKLRGVESQGMMCSVDELGLTVDDLPYADPDGILILDNDPDVAKLTPGMDVIEFLGLRDIAVEFEITNNRPDCLSVIGLAKETGATFNLPVEIKTPVFKGVDGSLDLRVTVADTKLCSRYMAAVVKNVKIAPSPRFIVERLRASGVRAINNIVDITNFVMLEYGHPMHAFDKRYVTGGEIIVRTATDGEKITLLDGDERILTPETLVIADTEKPIAVAGVMGGEFSGVMPDTAEVVFESACFDGVSVRKTAQRIGRRTESSARFEKSIDPRNAEGALMRALELVELLGCGEVVKTIIDEDFSTKEPVRVQFNHVNINKILGADIPESRQIEILERLEFKIVDGYAICPQNRTDIKLECDLAEEVARIYGYNEIPSSLPQITPHSVTGDTAAVEGFERRTARLLQGQGCCEMLTFSFISPKALVKAKVQDSHSLAIRNPLGEETGVMRVSMLPSLLEVIARNCNNRNSHGRFYEIGAVYLPNSGELADEKKVLCVGLYGDTEDFLTLKGLVEEYLDFVGVRAEFSAVTDNPSYHPGRCAVLSCKGDIIGIIGEIHPLVLEDWDINSRVYCAELQLEKLMAHSNLLPKFRSLPKFPSMTRDLSLLCDEKVTAGEIVAIITTRAKNLEQLSLFDIYAGDQIPDGKKSLSYKLIFRKPDATLTDAETDAVMEKILRALEEKGITRR